MKEAIPNVLEAIKSRRSIRKYLAIPVEFEKVGRILDAARLAPSAGNLQPWKFILVMEPKQRLEVAEACLEQGWVAQAPVQVVVCAEPKRSERYYAKKGERYATLDAAAAIQNMLLAAHGQGLGACWVSAMEEHMLRKVCGIPDDVIPVAVVTIGYADEKPVAPLKFEPHNVVFFNKYGNRVKDAAEVFGTYSTHVSKALAAAREWAENAMKKMRKV